jgi:hypothetical protein
MKIFPAVSVSELRDQLERDRQRFEQSTNELQTIVHEKTRPFKFLLEHPGLLIGSLASIFALYEVGTSVLSPVPLKAVNGTAKKTASVLGRLTRLGLGVAMKAATPAIASFVQKAWQYARAPKPPDDGRNF